MDTQNYLSIINPNAVEVGVPAASKEEVFDYVSKNKNSLKRILSKKVQVKNTNNI